MAVMTVMEHPTETAGSATASSASPAQAQATLTLKSGKTFMRQPLTYVVDGNEFVGLSIWLCLKMEDIPK